MIILGASKLRRQTHCMRQQKAIYVESTATRTTPGRDQIYQVPE